MKWEASAPNDQSRHPYELWYEETGALIKPDLEHATEALWYPHLLLLELDPQAEQKATLDEISKVLSDLVDRNEVTILAHDWAYCWYLVFHEQLQQVELIVFVKATLGSEKLEGLKDLQGLTNVEILHKGGPIAQLDQMSGMTSDCFTSVVDKFASANARSKKHKAKEPPIVGVVVDHALGFLNDTFCKPGDGGRESRFRHVWLQDDMIGNPTMPIGRTIDRADINRALTDLETDPFATEAAKYTELGASPIASSKSAQHGAGVLAAASHGTQTAQIAFGSTPEDPDWDFDLIGIQLPAASVALTNGFLHDIYVKSALNWAFITAFDIEGRPAKLFINHSFATYAGRHDGFDRLDADFQSRLHAGHAEMITLAAGNGFQSATHAAVSKEQIADPDYDSDLTLVVQPGSKQSTFVQFWADAGSQDMSAFPAGFEITTPHGDVLREENLQVGDARRLIKSGPPSDGADHQVLASVYCQLDTPKGIMRTGAPGRQVLTLAILPTETEFGGASQAPAGDWRIRFTDNSNMDAGHWLNIWVERGDTPDGFPAYGRQSYLSHPNYERVGRDGSQPDGTLELAQDTCPIRRFGTLAAAATASLPTVVAAYRESDDHMSDFSAASSDLFAKVDGRPVQPTLAAVAESSAARPNVLTTGTFSGSVRSGRGTSVSAPLAMRHAIRNVLRGRKDETPKAGLILDVTEGWGASTSKSDQLRAGYGLLQGAFKATLDRRRQ